jgi:hypothetical protein
MLAALAGADWATTNGVIASRLAAVIEAARNPLWGSEVEDMDDLRRILADQRA